MCWYFLLPSFYLALMIPTTNPETPEILGTAKVLGSKLITKYGQRESQMISRMLAEHVSGKAYHRLLAYPEATFTSDQYQIWLAAEKRLLEGEPLQYVIGKAWFHGLEFEVGPDTLIPRPETEELVELGLAQTQQIPSPKVLDIGTGSGCIAIAFAENRRDAEVHALDFSPEALQVARRNGMLHASNVNFQLVDILQPGAVSFEDLDLILCNPPYIPAAEQRQMDSHVTQYEPSTALFVPDDEPLLYYIEVSKLAKQWLKAGAWLDFEIHADFGKEVAAILEAQGFAEVLILKDMQGRDRMVQAQKPEKP
jgi:release factor glutamine methyltransferase